MTVTVDWGLAGTAESAQIVPESTDELISFLTDAGFTVDHPPFTASQTASTKDLLWTLPVLEVAQDVSISLLAECLVQYISGRISQSTPRRIVRILIRQRDPELGATEIRIEGEVDEVAETLRELGYRDIKD